MSRLTLVSATLSMKPWSCWFIPTSLAAWLSSDVVVSIHAHRFRSERGERLTVVDVAVGTALDLVAGLGVVVQLLVHLVLGFVEEVRHDC